MFTNLKLLNEKNARNVSETSGFSMFSKCIEKENTFQGNDFGKRYSFKMCFTSIAFFGEILWNKFRGKRKSYFKVTEPFQSIHHGINSFSTQAKCPEKLLFLLSVCLKCQFFGKFCVCTK